MSANIPMPLVEDALVRSEGRYRSLFDNLPMALVQLDVSGLFTILEEARAAGTRDLAHYIETDPEVIGRLLRVISAQSSNAAALHLFGAKTGEELLGPIDWVWTTSPGTIRRSVAARLRGRASYAEETKITTRAGEIIDVLYTITFPPTLGDRGTNVAGFVDLRERVRSGQVIEQMQADFAHSERVSMLGELTASIAHEVTQPLTAILGSAFAGLRWLDRPEPDLESARASLQHIVEDTHRATDTIARVRAMARKEPPHRTDCAMSSVVEDAVQFLRHESASRGVPIVLDLHPRPLRARIDRIQIQQVVVNLTLNAMQAMARVPRSGPVRAVHLRTRREGRFVMVLVEDFGAGIHHEDAHRLFESFFTTKPDGMGMGLRICRSIVEAHEGTIAAHNAETGGAVFTFTLPALA